jgi:hypothetical protein
MVPDECGTYTVGMQSWRPISGLGWLCIASDSTDTEKQSGRGSKNPNW